jgi:Flp pilus assembly secretin CpaC
MPTGQRRASARAFCSSTLLIAALCAPASHAAGTDERIDVIVDQAKLVKLPERIATVVVGNPLIADVNLQAGGLMIVTGKGYGATNVIAIDRDGKVQSDRVIQVEGPTDKLVTVYRGTQRESYSCTPICQRRVTLGDEPDYFTATLTQAGTLSNQATGSATATGASQAAAKP